MYTAVGSPAPGPVSRAGRGRGGAAARGGAAPLNGMRASNLHLWSPVTDSVMFTFDN